MLADICNFIVFVASIILSLNLYILCFTENDVCRIAVAAQESFTAAMFHDLAINVKQVQHFIF